MTDTPLGDLPSDLSPDVAAVIFGTQYDDTIQSLLGAIDAVFESRDEDLEWALEESKKALVQTVRLPRGLTVETSKPYVELSDILVAGLLAHRLYQRTAGLMEGPIS